MAETRKRRFGDRWDGRRVRTLDPYNALTPFIMKQRNDASNYFSGSTEVTEAERFLRLKRLNGYPGMGFLHLFIAAYVRVASQYPAVNRFVSGQRIYTRSNIEFVMTIKKEMRTDASETSIKVAFDPYDTIDDVYNKLNAAIEKVKKEGEDTSTDNVAKAFMKLPRLLIRLLIGILYFLDYFGKIPKSLIRASPFHGSVIITDLGSISLPPIYHHLYNFGNLPLFIAIGVKRKTYVLKPDGTVAERKYIDFQMVGDERVCDGFYFSQALKLFKSLLSKPQELEKPPEKVIEDID